VDASTPKDLYYYEPKNGHGLKHDLQRHHRPRPIGWISSRDGKGHTNLRALQLLQRVLLHPPIIGFSSTGLRTPLHIQETGEFVWNLATMDLAKQMNLTRPMSPTTSASSRSPG